MNYSAYLATGQIIGLIKSFSKINLRTHGQESIPDGSIIFVVNHFTRIETLLLPYHIYDLTRVPVWSLADHSLFEGMLGRFLAKVGVVSTRNPDRDRMIVKSLLTGEANWIIFPEGRMVKDKETASGSSLFGLNLGGRRSAHTGAANLAMRTEFYRKRLNYLLTENPAEAERLMNLFQIENMMPILTETTWIVPINLTYYPLRARENTLSALARHLARNISDRLQEELLTEGTMFFEGVDIDLRFGQAIPVSDSLTSPRMREDMFSLRQINLDDRLPCLQDMRREAKALMQRFMTDIYSMTTVNHDHLFASLLRSLPFNNISEIDFRRRVFLLTALVPTKLMVFCHQSLEVDQVALLTDDRHHKYRDFLEIARETGVVRIENGVIRINSANLTADSQFHRIRIVNPVSVVANEVRPMSVLRRQVRWMAWLPEMIVRSRVADILLKQAAEQFETDYAKFSSAFESREYGVGEPILLKGTSRRMGVVLVHGFLAAPREMHELAEYLNKLGLWVYCVRLRGHGTSPEDLATRKVGDWLESVDIGFAVMSAICRRVVVGGFSFGGGLALDCATRITGLTGVFAVSPPFRLLEISDRFASAVKSWNSVMDRIHFPGAAKEFVEHVPEQPLINYARVPIAPLTELMHFMKNLETRLAAVTVPALVIQAQGDPLVDPEGTALMFHLIGSGQKQYLPFSFNRHGILAGEGSENVHAAIAEFIDAL